MNRSDINKPVKPYFSRRGESIDDFVEQMFEGDVVIMSDLPGSTDTVLNIGLDAVRRRVQESGEYSQVSHQYFGTIPSEITSKNVQLISDTITDAFREITLSQPSLQIPIFTLECIEGDLTSLQETFLRLVNTRISYEDPRRRESDMHHKIAPIIQVINPQMDRKLFRDIEAKLTARKHSGEIRPEVMDFDIRSFDEEHLLALLQPEFPEEDIATNPDFRTLLDEQDGNARIAVFLRSYARKGTVHLINGDIEPLDVDSPTGVVGRDHIYRAVGPKPTFSQVYEALVGQCCHHGGPGGSQAVGNEPPSGGIERD